MVEHAAVNRGVVGSSPTPGACNYLRLYAAAPVRAVRERPEVLALAHRAARNPKAVGELSEIAVVLHLMRAGYDVARPFGDNARYDLVVDDGARLVRVQVKTARLRAGTIQFATSSSQLHRGRGRQHYRGACDLFAAYCPDLDKVYLVPVDGIGAVACSLRIEPPRNGQSAGVRWASDYELRSTTSRLR